MASKFVGTTLPGGRNGLDVPVAALAGLSVAFVVFAAPADLLSELVGSSGLPSILAAAEPPLGMKARIGLGAAGAFAMFTVAFLLLRWLDRFGARRAERAEDDAMEQAAPRLRRRDFHPDAAPRPPVLATLELGEPDLEPDPAPHPSSEPEPEPETGLEPARPLRRAWLPDRPAAAEPAEAAPAAPEPALIAPEPAPEAPVRPQRQPGSIDDLLARLEQGLARRRAPGPASAAAEAAVPALVPAPDAGHASAPADPEPADDRLQSAIDSLQRLASRRD